MIRSDKRLQKPTAVRAENWRGGLASAQSTSMGLKGHVTMPFGSFEMGVDAMSFIYL